ncbi:unnamed protein product [Effrenium voratum]|nr:unnamed protein product [Effrenium voratum]
MAAAAGGYGADPACHVDIRETLIALRGLVGPHASSAQLEDQLRRFSNDPRKAANGYFRSACAYDRPFDFQPRPMQTNPVATCVCPGSTPNWAELDPQLFPAAAYLEIADCWSLLTVSRELHQRVVRDEALWTAAFQCVFREVPRDETSGSQAHADAKQGASRSRAFERFTERWRQELGRVCPQCAAQEAIVPIVYGFPSAPLAAHYRQGSLVLTEVCGFLGPCWACRRCHYEFESYPYSGTFRPVSKARKYPFLRVCLAAEAAEEDTSE